MKQTNILRIGKVSSTNPKAATVKVVFSDMDNMVSHDLPLLFPQGLKNKAYAMPDVGENVVCLFIEQGVGDGFCIGSFYTLSDTPPVTNQDKVHYSFEDGSHVEYDRSKCKLTVHAVGDVQIEGRNITLSGGTIQINGDITLNGSTTLSGNVSLSGSVSCPGYCKC
ncbi:phage baseplate assembly protein V [Cellulosilyticum sp. ST5]|uniref:phage baseplate assembly protein V n=1 Tax=unclassified Cellulosilyticum TaxID=2643091 RepID=UPI0016800094|nr:phage baseplate assembly protein V [Cellulosilyticum sp. WCF-2]